MCSGTSGLVCGVRVQAYWSARDNACVIPGGVKSGQATGNPALIQGRFEHRGNFEMVVPLASGGLAHYDRANDLPFVPWFGPNDFAADVGELDAVTLIQSNFTTGAKIGDLEVVARFGQDLLFFAREDTPPYIWHGPFQATGFQQMAFSGNPVLIEGRFGKVGNFEMVVPLASGGLAHYDRANDLPGTPWFGPEVFATDVGPLDAVTMIQSNFTAGPGIGNLEVVARFGEDLLFFWREDVPPYVWHGPTPMIGFQQQAFAGNPAMVQGRFGKVGNFEMVVPLASGGLAHYDRANDLPGTPWFGPEVFATDVGPLDAVTMIQSNFTAGPGIGNLEVVARFGEDLLFFWREDVPPYVWHGPCLLATLL